MQYTNISGLTWDGAVSWANDLVYEGYDDWRLPDVVISDPSCTTIDAIDGYTCIASEMDHLYYETLGNPAQGPLGNTGPFGNLVADYYWSGTDSGDMPSMAYGFDFSTGQRLFDGKNFEYNAWAVRVGNSGISGSVVPEPISSTLFIVGGATLGFRRFRKKIIK